MARIIEPGHRFEQPLGDIHLVEERKLNGDARQFAFGETAFGYRFDVAVSPEMIKHPHAVKAEDCEERQDGGIENDYRPNRWVERIEITDIVAAVAQNRMNQVFHLFRTRRLL